MKSLFTDTAMECSKLITQRYSTSFSLGIKTLDSSLHMPIYAIYGFVRYADEIVDTFHDHDKKMLLDRFKKDTYQAIEEKISLNPVLHSFQDVVNEYKIEKELIEAFLYSMEMDLHPVDYTEENYKRYIYGSAEVVGLMCLRVFCAGDETQYQQLKDPACALGSAFQKVNFLRDIKSDYEDRGRVYFPGVDYNQFDTQAKIAIEADIQNDFDHALEGIKQLPANAKSGVYLAYVYYLNLFKKIKNSPAELIQRERVRIPDARKLLLLAGTLFRRQLKAI
ncbi:MAG: phytoene/squalene synthase family protein [Cyclobacteriaceae bacterium]|nr:phytoene/squalene synthase family protein [Cyclobacteriaceae bacterium]MCH8514965.1 phytoene/squalene synthase family protein [Cyclobacteriaceae bacterium]